MANQTAIPLIKTDNDSLNQVQQNANKVFRNMFNQLSDVQKSVSELIGLGDIVLSALTLTQFQAVRGTSWIISNGQSSIGTAYAALTGNNTVPNVSVSGTTAFIKVN